MIKIKELPASFQNADAETRNQMWKINVEEALKQVYSIEEITNLFVNTNASNRTYFKDFEKRIAELEKPKSILTDLPMINKNQENKEKKSFKLSEILKNLGL